MRKVPVTIAAAAVSLILLLSGCGKTTATEPPATAGTAVHSVAVIVLDAFGTPKSPDPQHQGNCAYSQLANDVGSNGAPASMPPGLSHGQAVYDVLRDELNHTNGLTDGGSALSRSTYGVEQYPWVEGEMHRWSNGGKEVVLLGVGVEGYATDEIVDRLESLLTSLADKGFRNFVLNMSFVIVPCNVKPFLTESDEALLKRYTRLINADKDAVRLRAFLDGLTKDNGNKPPSSDQLLASPGLASITRQVVSDVFYEGLAESDPGKVPASVLHDQFWEELITFVTQLRSKDSDQPVRVVPVGASGNGVAARSKNSDSFDGKQLQFPFAPAIWDSVVSASAFDGDGVPGHAAVVPAVDPALAGYSNYGEVMMDGTTDVTLSDGRTLRGTSFSAPRLSALEALYLLRNGPTCSPQYPPLGYADIDHPGWLNKPIGTAIRDECPPFGPTIKL